MRRKTSPPEAPDTAASSSEALREYYRRLVDEYQKAASIARIQLGHVTALLYEEDVFPSLPLPADLVPAIAAPIIASPSKAPKNKGKSTTVVPAPKSKTVVEEPIKTSKRRPSFKLQKAYQGKTLADAIDRLLHERRGASVTTDDVVQALYGDLKTEQFRMAKERITKILSKGKMEGKWDRVPGKMGAYTLSLDSLRL